MKKIRLCFLLAFSMVFTVFFTACNENAKTSTANASLDNTPIGGQSTVKDDVSMKDVVKVAIASPDHKTLVTAVVAAQLVDVLSNAGPFTVFAPTDAAFAKLPAGTVKGLLKPDKKDALTDILQYHVTTSSLKTEYLSDGMKLGMVNGGSATITVKDGKYQINGVNIVASVVASNGIVHVIDAVLLENK
jgi:uncharacterized surface protein with fasciclin (FAS1) repeats